jgi:hypothetical protein
MRVLACLFLLVSALPPALAQYGPPHHHNGMQRPMPPPERRMAWEERHRLREQVRSGQITREEARERWRQQRGTEPGRFSPEQREQLRRDVQDANRDLEKH